ncbi:hypothetical protein LBBP_02220 [Leptospira borgpetersenii serovar Ballum]|uniref:Uncharacterized protein n=1 Tax=Leptospira borgpetersenii serovar Ballum TaxID=280505 RepID=A0A0S2IS38_LEPBO|nr:hypothetical protein LBBP_02220 [Leptospira borgpetersenii serovar Ballum]
MDDNDLYARLQGAFGKDMRLIGLIPNFILNENIEKKAFRSEPF